MFDLLNGSIKKKSEYDGNRMVFQQVSLGSRRQGPRERGGGLGGRRQRRDARQATRRQSTSRETSWASCLSQIKLKSFNFVWP